MNTYLVIGNRKYSSWSLRAWWVVRRSGIVCEETQLMMDTPEFAEGIGRHSPSGRVPVLHDRGRVIWDSLAIAEYLAERCADRGLWPADAGERAMARSVCAEMHSGFPALRAQLPMNCRACNLSVDVDDKAKKDIARVKAIWRECLANKSVAGPWLFGRWSIADAFFAPVVIRFNSYFIAVDPLLRGWMDAVLGEPDIASWMRAGAAEKEVIMADELQV